MNYEGLRYEMLRKAPAWQPRGMAVISFAAAAIMAFITIFPVVPSADVPNEARSIPVAFAAGLIYWFMAAKFRVWMVHTIVLLGFTSGLSGLAAAETSLHASLILATLLWTGVFVGAAFRPPISRAYAAFISVGIMVALAVNNVSGDAPIGVAFAGSFIVTMEILSRATSQLRHEATTDSLTGLLNRTGLEREVARLREFGRDDRIAVMVIDLDGFKEINDRHGHPAGDAALVEFARTWQDASRAGELLARIGGDEFVAVFAEAEPEPAMAAMNRLRAASDLPWSGGLVISEPGESLEGCFKRADRKLYVEKASKKNQILPASDPAGAVDRESTADQAETFDPESVAG